MEVLQKSPRVQARCFVFLCSIDESDGFFDSEDSLNLLVYNTSTEKNLVVVYKKCVYFNILLNVEVYGVYGVEVGHTRIITFL